MKDHRCPILARPLRQGGIPQLINLVLDQQLIADIKALIEAIEEYAKTAGLQKPVAAKWAFLLQTEAVEALGPTAPFVATGCHGKSRRARTPVAPSIR